MVVLFIALSEISVARISLCKENAIAKMSLLSFNNNWTKATRILKRRQIILSFPPRKRYNSQNWSHNFIWYLEAVSVSFPRFSFFFYRYLDFKTLSGRTFQHGSDFFADRFEEKAGTNLFLRDIGVNGLSLLSKSVHISEIAFEDLLPCLCILLYF
jgi:hypothetical protein